MNDITENTNGITAKSKAKCDFVPANGFKSCLKAQGQVDTYIETAATGVRTEDRGDEGGNAEALGSTTSQALPLTRSLLLSMKNAIC